MHVVLGRRKSAVTIVALSKRNTSVIIPASVLPNRWDKMKTEPILKNYSSSSGFSRATVKIQNMYLYQYHNTKHVSVPLGTADIRVYFQGAGLQGYFVVETSNVAFSTVLRNLTRLDESGETVLIFKQ